MCEGEWVARTGTGERRRKAGDVVIGILIARGILVHQHRGRDIFVYYYLNREVY